MDLVLESGKHVIVLGAGPGGLACAHKLAEYGFKVTVLEKEDFVGGLSRTTVTEDGWRFDLGGHRWFTKNEALNDWFLRLMEGHLVTVQRTSRILFEGKYFDYPIAIKNVLKTAGIWTCFLCLCDYGLNTIKGFVKPPKIETMEDAFVAQFGRRLYEMFFRRYSEKVWGLPCGELSADWVSQRSKGLSVWTTLANALLKPKKKAASLIETFPYPRWGYQVISEVMAEDVCKHEGNRVELEALVKKVDVNDPDKVIVTYEKDGQSQTVEGDYVVSTLPLTGLLAYGLDPAPPQEIIDQAKSLRFRSIACVNLKLDMKQMSTDTWLYCHDEGIGFARFHEPTNWSPDMAPKGKTGVVLEVFYEKGDEVDKTTDDALLERAVEDLIRLGFITREQYLGGFVSRAHQAYPIYDMGYRAKVEAMHRHIEGLDRVAIVGRGGTFRYNNSDHSIEMGLITAQMINGEVDKSAVLDVNTSLEYGEKDLVSGVPSDKGA